MSPAIRQPLGQHGPHTFGAIRLAIACEEAWAASSRWAGQWRQASLRSSRAPSRSCAASDALLSWG